MNHKEFLWLVVANKCQMSSDINILHHSYQEWLKYQMFTAFQVKFHVFGSIINFRTSTLHMESSSQPSSNASSPETTTSASSSRTTSPELLEMECSFNTLLAGTREKQGHAMMRSQMDNLREQQQCITVLKLPCSHRTNQGLSQHLQQQTCHFHRIPEDVQVT